MDYIKGKLGNGIRIIHSHIPTLNSATFTVWYGVGSRYEDAKAAGISHFLEHMAFKGGKKYPTAEEITETLDSLGAEDNASTSQEYTNYYVRSATYTLPKAVEVLADSLLHPALASTEIEKERDVIIEEINMYEDDPQSCAANLYSGLIFPGHPLGRDIAGTKETVRSINRDDFIAFRQKHYVAENIVITISGGISYDSAYEIAEKYFGDLKNTEYQDIYKHYKHDQNKPRIAVRNKKTEQANLYVGFPGFPHGHRTRYSETLLAIILGGGMSSRLFREVREKRGLAYSVFANASHYVDAGEFSAYAGVPPEKAVVATRVMMDEFYKIASSKHGLTDKELGKAKSYLKGHLALSMESTKAVNYFFGREEIKGGKLRTIDEVFKEVDKVTVDNVLDVAGTLFVPSKLNIAVLGPYKDKTVFEKLVS